MKVNKRRKLNFFDRIFLWLSVIFGFALLLSYLSPVTDPRSFWPIAFFGLAYPILLAINGVLLIFWILRWSKYLLIPAICIAVGWGVLRNNIGFSWSTPPGLVATGKTLQIMTYNCHNFKSFGAANDPQVRHQMLEMIAGQNPDILAIQEFFTRKRGQYAMLDSICKLMRSDEKYFESFNLNTEQERTGLAIFSKYPIVNKGQIAINDDDNGSQCIYIDIKRGSQILRYYCVHLQSIRFQQEDYQYLSKVSKDGKPDVNSSRRIGVKLKRAFIKRSTQVAKIKQHTAQCPYPFIISGDFNDTPSSFAVHQMAKGLKNTFREKGSGFARTYNGSFPNYQIDYIMASKSFDVLSYNIIQKKLSDHYPVTSTLLLK